MGHPCFCPPNFDCGFASSAHWRAWYIYSFESQWAVDSHWWARTWHWHLSLITFVFCWGSYPVHPHYQQLSHRPQCPVNLKFYEFNFWSCLWQYASAHLLIGWYSTLGSVSTPYEHGMGFSDSGQIERIYQTMALLNVNLDEAIEYFDDYLEHFVWEDFE